MNTVLSIIQILVVLLFGMAGLMKLIQPKEKLAGMMAWTNDFSQGQIRLIGALEVAGALGVLLPSLTGILPWVTPLAALGLVLTMVGAAVTHFRRKENTLIAVNLVLAALAAVVVVGYWPF